MIRTILFFFACLTLAVSSRAEAPESAPPVRRFKHILIASSAAKAVALQVESESQFLVIKDIPLLQTEEFAEALKGYEGQPITTESANKLAADVGEYIKKHDRFIVSVEVPGQSIAKGEYRLGVVIGTYKELTFRGNRWFSNELISRKLGIRPGDEVRYSSLEEAVAWANNNPFRMVRVVINNQPAEPDKAELIVNVRDTFPIRVSATADNGGVGLLGQNRYSGSVQYGNLWGIDHQITLQYMTSNLPKNYKAYSMDYRLPVGKKDFMMVAASYGKVESTFANGDLSAKGNSISGILRYVAPRERGRWSFEYSGGLDFLSSDNNVEYGGFSYWGTSTHSYQASVAETIIRKDTLGRWAISSSIAYSPGNIDSRNTQAIFGLSRYGAKPRYFVATLQLQRMLILPYKMQLFGRVIGQAADKNLLANSELSIGGSTSIRGYDEHLFYGDQGIIGSLELQSPLIRLGMGKISKRIPPLESRFFAFWDIGSVDYKHSYVFNSDMPTLKSLGLGFRCNIASNLNLSAEYGWQLAKVPQSVKQHGAGHLRATIAY